MHARTTSNAQETRKLSHILMMAISALILFVLFFTIFAFWMGGDDTLVTHNTYPVHNDALLTARSHTNCSDFAGAVEQVKSVADGRGYLHVFEYERLHPCCTAQPVAPVGGGSSNEVASNLENILFIVMTSSKTEERLQVIKDSWAADLGDSLLLVSDVADETLGTVTFDEISGKRNERNPLDSQHRSVVGLKHIYSDAEFARYKDKKWFFLVDDATWVNIPAVLHFLKQMNCECPVIFSYVWSGVWIEDLDYASGAAGFLLSKSAFEQIAPSFEEQSECAFAHYSEIAFSKCAWHRRVQLVHHPAFYFDRPEMSKDRHEHVWYPPIGEAMTYHDVYAKEMLLMTSYVNERWGYRSTKTDAVPALVSDEPSRHLQSLKHVGALPRRYL